MDQSLEAQLQTTLNMIPAYTWYAAPSGALTFVNKRAADYGGLAEDHPLRFGIDVGAAWDSHIAMLHPDDHEETRRVWSNCLSSGRAAEVVFRVRSAEGNYRWFLSRTEPLRANDGTILYWIGINFDIEERKQAEDTIRGQEAEQRQMLDFAPELVVVFGPKRQHLYANRAALDYVGLTLDEWRQMTPERGSVVHPEDLDRAREHDLARLESAYTWELRLRKADGSYRWFLAQFNPVRDEKGQIVRWHVSHTDIDDRKRAEERLQH